MPFEPVKISKYVEAGHWQCPGNPIPVQDGNTLLDNGDPGPGAHHWMVGQGEQQVPLGRIAFPSYCKWCFKERVFYQRAFLEDEKDLKGAAKETKEAKAKGPPR